MQLCGAISPLFPAVTRTCGASVTRLGRLAAGLALVAALVIPAAAADTVPGTPGQPAPAPATAPASATATASASTSAAQPPAAPRVPAAARVFDKDLPPPPEVETVRLDQPLVGTIVHTRLPVTKRPVSYYVPKSYDRNRFYPLLIECTGEGQADRNIARLWQLADKFNMIVVSPDTWAIHGRPPAPGASSAGVPPGSDQKQQTRPAWSRGGVVAVPVVTRERGQILPDLVADTEAIAELVRVMPTVFSIDRKLVVLTGYSGGAWTVYYAGLSKPSLFAGLSIRSGSFHPECMPRETGAALTLPITIVIGEKDLDIILDDTVKAEAYFKQRRFSRFDVERLPNSGHDNRPEVAFNFVQQLKAQLAEEHRPRYDTFMKSAEACLDQGATDQARIWLEKAAELERRFGYDGKAVKALEKLKPPAPAATDQPKDSGRPASSASPAAPQAQP